MSPELRTQRLLLRILRPEDRDAFIQAESQSAAFFARYAPLPPDAPTPAERFDTLLAEATHLLQAGTHLRLAAFTLATHALIGHYNLSDVVRGVSQRCNIGYRTYAAFTRQGLAYEAISAVLAHAFSITGLNLHRVECAIQPANTPSIQLAQKLGFRQEGFAPRYLYLNSQWQDHILLAKTVEDPSPPISPAQSTTSFR